MLSPDQGRILLNWVTENEDNASRYFIERSIDGSHFIDIATIDAKDISGATYQWTDHFPASEYNYYRVKTIELNGTINFSDIVTVKTAVTVNQQISVFPNPASTNNFNVNLSGQPAGYYQARIFSSCRHIIDPAKIL